MSGKLLLPPTRSRYPEDAAEWHLLERSDRHFEQVASRLDSRSIGTFPATTVHLWVKDKARPVVQRTEPGAN
jgi:hypothetical protein